MIEIDSINKKNLRGLKFIDLFAGIGGFHLALSSFDTECVFASEWDEHAKKFMKIILDSNLLEILLKLTKEKYLIMILFVEDFLVKLSV